MNHFDRRLSSILLVLVVLLGIVILAVSRARLWLPQEGGTANRVETGQAGIAFLSPSHAPELWVTPLDGSQLRQLTETGGRLFDYTFSLDGTRIIFSAYNEQNGIDLWEIDRQGGEPFPLLPCGTDWCFNPAYAPGGSKIAYSRRTSSGLAGSQPGPPHIWLIQRDTLQTEVLFVDPSVGGHSPLWSPDGRYLAFIDDLQQGVRLVDFQQDASSANGDFFLETGPGDGFSWSPDSRHLFLSQTVNTGEYANTTIYLVEAATRITSQWLGEENAEFYVPAWSPDGDWAVVARRGFSQGAGRQLWLVQPDGSQRQAITEDPRVNHSSYQWDPTGMLLVFQRLDLNSASNLPEVRVWSRTDGQTRTLAEDAFLPRWLPSFE